MAGSLFEFDTATRPRPTQTVNPTPEPAPAKHVSMRHVPALDGLRGTAVAAVLVFHGGQLTGGFLGVDLFFVLSGFLITTLLLIEHRSTGRIDLAGFWKRRARRLLPAVFALVAAVSVLALFADPADRAQWRTDGLATIFYVANWLQAAGENGYWDQYAAPSPFHHTWSLAIEEQFYVVWPLLVTALLVWLRRSARTLMVVCLAGAVASAAVMAMLFTPEDPNRAYLGTDTRAAGMLLGAAAAAWWHRRGPARSKAGRWGLEAFAVAAVVLLGVAWTVLDGSSPLLYRFGFLGLEAACVVVIFSIMQPTVGPVGRLLSIKPLRALGLISYGLYLWHWPVYLVVDEHKDAFQLSAWPLLGVKIAISLVLAVVSYYVVEKPLRRGGLRAWKLPALAPAAAMLALVALIATTTVGVSTEVAAGDGNAEDLMADGPVRETLPELSIPQETATTMPPPPSGPVPRPAGRPPRVMLVGDSVGFIVGRTMESKLARPLQFTVANRASVACPFIRGSGRTREKGGKILQAHELCMKWEEHWTDDVDRFRPDVVVMAFGAGLAPEREIDGAWHEPCSATFRTTYLDQVLDAIDLLSKHGAVVFIAPPAYPRFVFAEPEEQDPRVDCVADIYDEAIRARPAEARRLSLDRYVCPTSQCREEIDGVELRDDGVHYEGKAAELIGRWIIGEVLEPPA